MAKILILANSSSGLYGFRNELVVKLLEQHEVHVSLPDDTNNKELEEEGCVIYKTPINRRGMNPIQDIGLFRAYRKLLKDIRPDVVLTYTIKPNVYGGLACRVGKVPYIANITGLGSALENGGMLQRIALALYKIGLKKASCVFLQNQFNLGFFEEHRITKAPKRLIPGSGVNLSKFQVKPLPKETKEFIYVSRVMKEKGIEEYLEAAERVQKKYPDAKFHILGYCEEAYEERLKEAKEKGIVIPHGSVKDVRPYIYGVQCLVHPSFYPEGMSNVCLEAAACGRAVITTRRPGCKETVEDGVNGYLIPEQNADALTEAIVNFLELSYEQKTAMGLAGRKRMEEKFDRAQIVEAYEKEIKKILA